MLTARQNELLIYLENCQNKKGFCPSYDKMASALGLKSKSGIHRLITALEERGFIRRLKYRKSSVQVIRSAPFPPAAPPVKPCCPHCGGDI